MVKQTAVLITGASSGIGLELAKTFAKHGHSVLLLARNTRKLQQISRELRKDFNVMVDFVEADLSQPNASTQIAEEVNRRNLNIDILVNNAGFGLQGSYADLEWQRQLDMLQVNIVALSHLTRLFLPAMIERNSGGVMNVASTAAFLAGPNMALYYATKAFVLSLTEALHEEVAGTNVHITCLCPGPTHTGFFAAGNMDGGKLLKMGAQTAEDVAQFGYAAFQSNQAIAISGLQNKLVAFAGKLSPRFMTRRIAKVLNR